MTDQHVWLITGASSGFGRELAKAVIARGCRVVVTARNAADLDGIGGAPEQVFPLDLDVTNYEAITTVIAAATERFGRIDVLANVAGYGYMSSAEEGEEARIRAMFDTNVFGLFAITREILPIMRAQRSGHVISITSVAGIQGMPRSAYYSATKHAVEGFSKALAAEVEPLGIRVTCVEPGAFRTNFAGSSGQTTKTKIKDYAETVGASMDKAAQGSGNQPGDPARAALAMISLTEEDNPPHHLVLGAIGYEGVVNTIEKQLQEIRSRREVALSVDF
ncbi:oxidoreductase [Sphingomonas sp. OK281]|uniref:oxidoreductase n=1 Tax=Sphingomonas sp. OK281 TaxID=1881067 RepID=UPI0008EE167F|nr:oxidoreductase [Sphingomonas sp. OK281]RYF10737.1 MAG: SDR family NAD(P)-dependent oxidoreductase [Oxalobacteraceae bacterium]SFO44231.1 Short-chain dehydrogenase [Sphingomonas sp. OK281]